MTDNCRQRRRRRRRRTSVIIVSALLAGASLALLLVPWVHRPEVDVVVGTTAELDAIGPIAHKVLTVWEIPRTDLVSSARACPPVEPPRHIGNLVAWIKGPGPVDEACLASLRSTVSEVELAPSVKVVFALPRAVGPPRSRSRGRGSAGSEQPVPLSHRSSPTAPASSIIQEAPSSDRAAPLDATAAVGGHWADGVAGTLRQLIRELPRGEIPHGFRAPSILVAGSSAQPPTRSLLQLDRLAGAFVLVAVLTTVVVANRAFLICESVVLTVGIAVLSTDRWFLAHSLFAIAGAGTGILAVGIATSGRLIDLRRPQPDAASVGVPPPTMPTLAVPHALPTPGLSGIEIQAHPDVMAASHRLPAVLARPMLACEPPSPLPHHGGLTAVWPGADTIGTSPNGSRHLCRSPRVVTVPDTICDGTTFGALEVRAASVRGLSHRYEGTVRQDAFSFGASADGHYAVLAVADGVSSAARSELGAEAAVIAAVERALDSLDAGTDMDVLNGSAVVSAVCATIRSRAAARLSMAPEEVDRLVATTLALAVIDAVPRNGKARARVMTVGNSEAVVIENGQITRFGEKRNDAIVDNRVAWLPGMPGRLVEATIEIDAPAALVLVSDGVTEALGLDGTGPIDSYLATKWRDPQSPLELAHTLGFASKACLDDRVVCGAWWA